MSFAKKKQKILMCVWKNNEIHLQPFNVSYSDGRVSKVDQRWSTKRKGTTWVMELQPVFNYLSIGADILIVSLTHGCGFNLSHILRWTFPKDSFFVSPQSQNWYSSLISFLEDSAANEWCEYHIKKQDLSLIFPFMLNHLKRAISHYVALLFGLGGRVLSNEVWYLY